ncbi:MAG: hypothetical protein LQ339_001409 [Xanthoria mediterranea]|nr:MAG: hypothetical protein LQ339_001409 [Xanthoria mediterranea]
MVPKPFPFPVGVGVDICHVKRISSILNKQDDYVTRWAKKVFTRQEWPSLWQSFHRAIASSNKSGFPKPQLSLPKLRTTRPGKQKSEVGGTPLEASVDIMRRPPVHELPPSTPSLSEHKWRVLAQHLAGRWAAKEATVKASRQRKLLLKDISIVRCNSHGGIHALIAPEHTTDILMSPEVATKRGLSAAQSPDGSVLGQIVNGHHTQTVPRHRFESPFYLRKAKIKDEDQQIAEISISHDNGYAVAICMALVEGSHSKNRSQIVDDGLGEPLHEPEWGDVGYLEDADSSDSSNA